MTITRPLRSGLENRGIINIPSEGELFEGITGELKQQIKCALPEKTDPLFASAHHHFDQQGKLLRGQLAYKVARELGIERSPAMSWAIAVEFMHNASLVHDDICDGDQLRRGVPAVWSLYGVPVALCLGDWLLSQSFAFAAKAEAETQAGSLIPLLSKTMRLLSSGQAREFQMRGYPNWDDYEAIVGGKTAPLLHACIEGALLMRDINCSETSTELSKILNPLGLAFQMANDLEDILGSDGSDVERSDLMRAAPNAAILAFRDTLRPARLASFDRWLKSPERESLSFWHSAVIASGALGSIADRIQILTDQIEEQIARLDPRLAPHLREIATYLTRACKQAIAASRLVEAAQ